MIDNDNGIEAKTAVAELDNAHGSEPTPYVQAQRPRRKDHDS